MIVVQHDKCLLNYFILNSKFSRIFDKSIIIFDHFSVFFRIIEFRNFGFEIKMDIFGWKFEILVNFQFRIQGISTNLFLFQTVRTGLITRIYIKNTFE